MVQLPAQHRHLVPEHEQFDIFGATVAGAESISAGLPQQLVRQRSNHVLEHHGGPARQADNLAGQHLEPGLGAPQVNAATAKTLWRVKNESGEVTADGRRVYVSSAGRINAYDAKSGKLLWTRTVNAPGRPIRAGGLLYTVAGDTKLVLLPTNGKPISYGTSHTGLTDHIVAAGGAGQVLGRGVSRSGVILRCCLGAECW
jgi:PQQ-like domain